MTGSYDSHDVEQRGLQHGAGAVGEPLRLVLELVAHAGQRRGLAVADAEDVVAPGVEEQLAELDLLALVDVPGGRHDGQQAVAVALDLRAVVLVAGVGDRQLGQLEGVADRVELGVGRHAQAEPAEPGAAALGRQLLDGVRLQGPPTLDVPRGVDDHGAIVARERASRDQTLNTTPRSGTRNGAAARQPAPRLRGRARRARYISWAIAPATFGAAKLVPLQRRPAAVLVDDAPQQWRGRRTSVKNVLTTSTPGAQASTHGPKLENAARPSASSAPTPTTPGSAAGKYGRDVRVVARRGDDDAVPQQPADRRRHRRRPVVRCRSVPNDMTTMSMLVARRARRARSMRRDDGGVVAVAVARQHARVVDHGRRGRAGG